VRAKAVVVLGIGPKDAFKMPCIDYEKVIEALRSDGPDKALRVGVRVGRPEWGLQDLGTSGPKDGVEACHVLRVTIAYEAPEIDLRVGDVTRHRLVA
jgi:hypothetical protein